MVRTALLTDYGAVAHTIPRRGVPVPLIQHYALPIREWRIWFEDVISRPKVDLHCLAYVWFSTHTSSSLTIRVAYRRREVRRRNGHSLNSQPLENARACYHELDLKCQCLAVGFA